MSCVINVSELVQIATARGGILITKELMLPLFSYQEVIGHVVIGAIGRRHTTTCAIVVETSSVIAAKEMAALVLVMLMTSVTRTMKTQMPLYKQLIVLGTVIHVVPLISSQEVGGRDVRIAIAFLLLKILYQVWPQHL